MAMQEPPSGESTTTECGVNYQLHAVISEMTQWGTPSSSRPQPATDNGVRDGRLFAHGNCKNGMNYECIIYQEWIKDAFMA